MLNILAGLGGVLGAIGMLIASQTVQTALPYVLAFAAGNFLYIAMADLIPDLHRGNVQGGAFRQMALIGAGLVTIILL
jgi:zinc and cadmium transporter